jgi:zinc and cadmium transporter
MEPFILALLASLSVSLLSFSGGLLLLSKHIFNKQTLPYLISFAAGVMLGATFLDLIPEALNSAEQNSVLFYILLGIIISFSLEKLLVWHHHHDDHHRNNMASTIPLILIGDGFHNLLDGVAIAVAFSSDPAIGLVTTFAIALHEIPQELADFSVLIYAGLSKKKALWFNFISALPALFGTVLGFVLINQFSALSPILLAFTSGMFIYIALADLVPELHKHTYESKSWKQIVPFLFGILLMLLLTSYLNV